MKDRKEEILGILLISLGILVLLSLMSYTPTDYNPAVKPHVKASTVQNSLGVAGAYISYYLIRKTIGYCIFIVPILIILWGWNQFREEKYKWLLRSSIYLPIFAFYISVALALYKIVLKGIKLDEQDSWGMIGGFSAVTLTQYFGAIGSVIVFLTVFFITLMLVTKFSFASIYLSFSQRFRKILSTIKGKHPKGRRRERRKIAKPVRRGFVGGVDETGGEEIWGGGDTTSGRDSFRQNQDEQNNIGFPGESLGQEPEEQPGTTDSKKRRKYVFPPVDLLDEPPEEEDEITWDELSSNAKTLIEKLAEFGIEGKVVGTNPGPVITRYEIEPAPGVKVNRFTSLADDLALVMRAKRIRVIAPIPGKAAIGIEIPNRKSSIVYLKSIIDSPEFQNSESVLTMALGKTIAGEVFIADLANMPHLLIAGATGSGKSVCLNTIIASILFKAHPSQVQFVLIDPKRLELTPYAQLKDYHLTYREDLDEAVVTSASNAVGVLRSLEVEMERRYQLLAQAGVRNIDEYNSWLNETGAKGSDSHTQFRKLEYLIMIVDELADLMLTAAKEVEEPIARLTQMSRAVGIHLIVATQRPSVDVITGVIKANFPARMAFQVATKTDSRTILDMNGAEKLLGSGDMLFLPPGSPEPIRIHCSYVSHEEIKRIMEHIKNQPPLPSKFKLPLPIEEVETSEDRYLSLRGQRDELFNEAAKLVVRHQQGSVSLLQRRLKIGYARAARLIDELEEAGFVGPFDGSKAREVLIDENGLTEMGIY